MFSATGIAEIADSCIRLMYGWPLDWGVETIAAGTIRGMNNYEYESAPSRRGAGGHFSFFILRSAGHMTHR